MPGVLLRARARACVLAWTVRAFVRACVRAFVCLSVQCVSRAYFLEIISPDKILSRALYKYFNWLLLSLLITITIIIKLRAASSLEGRAE